MRARRLKGAKVQTQKVQLFQGPEKVLPFLPPKLQICATNDDDDDHPQVLPEGEGKQTPVISLQETFENRKSPPLQMLPILKL